MPSRAKLSRIFKRLGLFTILAVAALYITAVGVGAQSDSIVNAVQSYFGVPVDTPAPIGRSISLTQKADAAACAERAESPSATCPKTVLPTDTSSSQNARAPATRFASSRAVYLITAAEMAAAGYPNGEVPTTLGWDYFAAPNVSGTAPLKIYLQNTTDTTYLKGTSFATAITGMTNVHNASTTLPGTQGVFDITFAGGSTFTYTGGGVYVAYDWGPYAGTLSTNSSIATNTSLLGGLAGVNSSADGLTASNFRPETRLSSSTQNDAGVTAVYAFGELPRGKVPAQAIQAVITNSGALTKTNITVTLNITGAETFTDTKIIPTLNGCGSTATVTFANFTPTNAGADTITVSLPNDDVAGNNSRSQALKVTPNSYSYKIPGSTASSGVGFDGVTGALVSKFTTSVATAITDVKLEFNATGGTYRVAIYGDASGTPLTTPLYVDSVDRTVAATGPVTINLPAPVAVGPGSFYVGVQQTGTTNLTLSFDTENPIRSGAFFLANPLPVTTWFPFEPDNPFKLNIGVNLLTKSIADFDGDGKTDVSVYRPSEGNWYLNRSTAGMTIVRWGGAAGDVIIPGDFDGDGKTDFAIWRPILTDNIADFYVLNSSTFVLSGYAWGVPGDTPVVGDYDADGKADLACFRPSTTNWYILKSTTPTQTDIFQFGLNGDVAMNGDFNGDGKTDLVVYRPSTRFWFWNNATGTPAQNFGAMQWGDTSLGDVLVPADYDGDGKTDVAVFRASDGVWYIVRSSDGGQTFLGFGINGDIPVPADYDGDGKADIAVYRPSTGIWYINRSTSGFIAQPFGISTDKPVPAAYHP